MSVFNQRSRLKALPLLFFAAIFWACNPAYAETGDTHHPQHSQEWPGVYNGLLPCADCKGVKTSLALNTNHTYIMITEFMGKSPREFTEKGKFIWSEDSNKIVLTSRDNSTIRQYQVGENSLIQLDGNGNRYTGSNAGNYILRRNDPSSIEPKHAH